MRRVHVLIAGGLTLLAAGLACGLTLVPADPKVDARMMRVPAPDSGVTFTLRSVQPPICKTP